MSAPGMKTARPETWVTGSRGMVDDELLIG
jgi:hypothetical protein